MPSHSTERPTPLMRLTTIDDAPPAEAHADIVELIRYWKSLSPAPGMLPGRQRFEPLKIPKLLPHLWLVDVVPDDPRRYRARLVGGAVINGGARFRPGKFLTDTITADEAVRVTEVIDGIVAHRHVDWRRGPSILQHMEHIYSVERAMMPMASDGRTVDLVLCMTLFYWTDGRIY